MQLGKRVGKITLQRLKVAIGCRIKAPDQHIVIAYQPRERQHRAGDLPQAALGPVARHSVAHLF